MTSYGEHPVLSNSQGLVCHGMSCHVPIREEDVEAAEEEGFSGKGLKPTEDRFLRLHDMERFVQAAERAELDDDEDEDMSDGEPLLLSWDSSFWASYLQGTTAATDIAMSIHADAPRCADWLVHCTI